MLKILPFLAGIFLAISSNAQLSVTPRVDERVELLGTIFRLAGASEYNHQGVPAYSKGIDSTFSRYSSSGAVLMAKELRFKHGISYDAVMLFALCIRIEDSVSFRNEVDLSCMGARWNPNVASLFLREVDQFYRMANFHAYFQRSSEVYLNALSRFTPVAYSVDMAWFKSFFGDSLKREMKTILSLTNGTSSYGPKIVLKDGSQENYAIIGTWQVDRQNQPLYSDEDQQTLVHEYCHSFCNPIVDRYYDHLEPSAKAFFNESSAILRQQAYGSPKSMMYELLVRACTIQYEVERNGAKGDALLHLTREEQCRGFLWIDKLVDLLGKYSNDRRAYATLDDFMPEVVSFASSLSAPKAKKKFTSKCTRILAVNITNGAGNVSSNIRELVVTFDSPMNLNFRGLGMGRNLSAHLPKVDKGRKPRWNSTRTVWTLPIILEPNTEYSLSFPSQFYRNSNGYPLSDSYYLDFKTGN